MVSSQPAEIISWQPGRPRIHTSSQPAANQCPISQSAPNHSQQQAANQSPSHKCTTSQAIFATGDCVHNQCTTSWRHASAQPAVGTPVHNQQSAHQCTTSSPAQPVSNGKLTSVQCIDGQQLHRQQLIRSDYSRASAVCTKVSLMGIYM